MTEQSTPPTPAPEPVVTPSEVQQADSLPAAEDVTISTGPTPVMPAVPVTKTIRGGRVRVLPVGPLGRQPRS